MEIEYDKIYYSNNYGPYKCIKETRIPGQKGRAAEIEFINTGYKTVVPFGRIKKGTVKDIYAPVIYNVACIGNASSTHRAHPTWSNMIARCYNPNNTDYYNYGAKGVRVCSKWLCFEFFLQDLPYIDGYENWLNNPGQYQLDKDYKQQGLPPNKKIYSLETCIFIHKYCNTTLSNKSNHYLGIETLPSGKLRTRCKLGNQKYELGLFDDEIAAANAYNNFIKYNLKNSKVLLNNVPYMSPEEVMKKNQRKNKVVCKIIER